MIIPNFLKILLFLLISSVTLIAGEDTEHDFHDHQSDVHPAEQSDSHEDEIEVILSPEAMRLGGITVSTIRTGAIQKTIELPGEIGFNEDRLIHISPRFAGIALTANYRVGDYVREGATVARIESNESMTAYTIQSPMSGWVIDRHITPGEYVSEENSIYIIADLATVWVNLAVYPKNTDLIKKGQPVSITAVGSEASTSGIIEYVTPIMDLQTRSATARITLPNPGNNWRPGMFIKAQVESGIVTTGQIVENDAVQFLNEKAVLFIEEETSRFVPVEVATGEKDANHTRIISHFPEGTKYVSTGAFELKAKIVTENLDAHAGHGH